MRNAQPQYNTFAAAFLVAALFCAQPLMAATQLERGKALAQKQCGPCHATGRQGASPNPKSPPFRELSRRYPVESLEEALAEGIVVGHEGAEMPAFQFASNQIEDLIAYLQSIQQP